MTLRSSYIVVQSSNHATFSIDKSKHYFLDSITRIEFITDTVTEAAAGIFEYLEAMSDQIYPSEDGNALISASNNEAFHEKGDTHGGYDGYNFRAYSYKKFFATYGWEGVATLLKFNRKEQP